MVWTWRDVARFRIRLGGRAVAFASAEAERRQSADISGARGRGGKEQGHGLWPLLVGALRPESLRR